MKAAETVPDGISNEELWMLVRRFNRQVSHVKALPTSRGQRLDLNRAVDEQFPQDKLQITIERFYTSVIIRIRSFFRHVAKLRSWEDPRRTGVFCAVYSIAWLLNILLPVLIGVLFFMIFFPFSGTRLFPPLPDTQVDKGPKEGNMFQGSGAEAVDLEVTKLIEDITDGAIEDHDGNMEVSTEIKAPIDPFAVEGEEPGETPEDAVPEGELKKPPPKAINQTMRIISDITDVWEKFSNLLSPQPPFYMAAPRLQLAGILISACLACLLLSNHAIAKCVAFMIGLGFFGDPVFQRTVDFLNQRVPDWKEYLDLERTLLKGVPTNAQLTLTLLRMGETNCNPLTPPARSSETRPSWLARRIKAKMPSDTDQGDGQAVSSDSDQQLKSSEPSKTRRKKRWIKAFRFVSRAITMAIKSHIALDRAMAIAGSTNAKGLIGMLRSGSWIAAPLGANTFEAKFERKRGTVVIDSSKEQAVLYFSTSSPAKLGNPQLDIQKSGSVRFQIPISDIRELKKTEGLGWKGKLIVELAAGSRDSADGLVIQGIEPDQTYHLTGIRGRNQLFNRLIANEAQFWEIH